MPKKGDAAGYVKPDLSGVPPTAPFTRVAPERWQMYFACRAQGMSQRKASAEAGISLATVSRMEQGKTTKSTAEARRLWAQSGIAPVRTHLTMHNDAKRALEDFGFFRKRFFGRVSSPWQEDAGYRLAELMATPDREYVVMNMPPGSGKSTLMTHDVVAWLLCRDRSLRVLIGSATQSLARTYVSRLRNTFDRINPPRASEDLLAAGLAVDAGSTLMSDYGRFRPPHSQRWRDDEFVIAQSSEDDTLTDKESSVTAFGRDTGVLGGRFDLCIWDDLVDRKTLRSAEARAKLEEDFDNELETRLEPGGLFVLQGQRMGPADLYRYALDKKGAPPIDEDGFEIDDGRELPRKYHHIVYPAHDEKRCEGKHPRTMKAWPQSCLLEPVRLDWALLRRVQSSSEGKYRTVYQQEDLDPDSVLVHPLWVKGGNDPTSGERFLGCWDESRKLGEWPQNLIGKVHSIACVDPSGERYWGATHWASQDSTDTDHLVQLSRQHMMAGQLLDQLQDGTFVGLMEDWQQNSRAMGHPITHWIVEINAAQRYLLQYRHVMDWQRSRQVIIIPHSTHKNRSDPERGVETLGNVYKYGQVRLPSGDQHSRLMSMKLVQEATTYPAGPSTDLLMSQWFLRYNLPNLRRKNSTFPTQERPSWLGGGVHLQQARHLFAVGGNG